MCVWMMIKWNDKVLIIIMVIIPLFVRYVEYVDRVMFQLHGISELFN